MKTDAADSHVPPYEDAQVYERMKIHTFIGKILIIHREWVAEKISVILVREPVGMWRKLRLGLMEVTRAKLRQAADLMEKHGIDCWIVQFGRETGLRSDPLAYLIGAAVTWPSAFLLNRDGRTAAIVGTGDSAQVEATGLWDVVRGYLATPRDDLVAVLDSWKPKAVGVTWSASDDTADSITFGMYRMLESLLAGTPYVDRLVSAGELAGEVRRRKLPDEIEGIHSAIAFTEQVFQRIEAHSDRGSRRRSCNARSRIGSARRGSAFRGRSPATRWWTSAHAPRRSAITRRATRSSSPGT